MGVPSNPVVPTRGVLYISLGGCVLGWGLSHFLRVDINGDEQVCVFDSEDGETDTTPVRYYKIVGAGESESEVYKV